MLKIAVIMLFSVLLNANEIKTFKDKEIAKNSYPQKEICVANVADVNRRGCCSHHVGVCGCSGNKKKCCDGTMSPTCKCGE